MSSRGTKRLALAIALAIVAIFLSLRLFAATSTQPKITWSPASAAIITPAGATSSIQLSFTSNQNLQNIVIEPVPAVASFLTLQPNTLATIFAGQAQQVQATFSIPINASLGTTDGTIHLRSGSRTIPQTMKVSLTVVKQGVVLNIPPNYQLNSTQLALGGPISLNNFGNQYYNGGIIPVGGSDIYITSQSLPTPPLSDFIANELTGDTVTSSGTITVSGTSCAEVFYTESFGTVLTYKDVAVYCPHNTLLYKIYLSYRSGDPSENQILADFQQLLNTVQFTQ